jgi:hypothetical protein
MTGIGTFRRLSAGVVGAALGSLLILGAAAPAYAVAQPVLTFHSPPGGVTLTSPAVAINGSASFTPDPAYGGGITNIQVAVNFGGHTVASCNPCGSAGNTAFGFTPSFAANGPYSVSATVSANETLLATGLNPQNRSGSASTSFRLAVPPAAPRSVTTRVNSDGSVTVSWARNTEADLSGYQVQRKEPAGAWSVVAPNLPPSATTFTDSGTSHGGDFSYLVSAFRPGGDGTLNTALVASAGLVGASVPVPPPPTTVPVIGQPIPFDTTTSTPTPASTPAANGSNTPDLSAFLAQAAKPGAATGGKIQTSPPARLVIPGPAGPPDTYDPNLPFPAGSPRQAAGAPRVALPGQPASSTQQRSILYSVAGGLFLCVLGFGVRSLNRRGGPPALESLGPPEAAGGGGAVGRASGVAGASGASGIGKIIPASVAAKAAARARAAFSGDPSETTVSPSLPAAWSTSPPPAAPATDATTPARAANRPTNPASAANPSPPPPAGVPLAAAPLSAAPAPAPVAPSEPAADLPDPVVAAPDPAAPQRPLRPSWPASADRRPSLEEAVDYFRLLKAEPLAGEDPAKVEVTAPAG